MINQDNMKFYIFAVKEELENIRKSEVKELRDMCINNAQSYLDDILKLI